MDVAVGGVGVGEGGEVSVGGKGERTGGVESEVNFAGVVGIDGVGEGGTVL